MENASAANRVDSDEGTRGGSVFLLCLGRMARATTCDVLVTVNFRATHLKGTQRSMIAVALVMIVIFSVGLRAYVTAKNSSAGAFWPAVPMLLAVTFACTGLSLRSMGKPLLIASIVVLCAAIIMCLVAVIMDGTAAERIHHTDFSLCHYSTENDYTPPCIRNSSREYYSYPKRYCVCCSQWRNSYVSDVWVNVEGCEDISVTFQALLWTTMTFNICGIVACVIATSFLGGYLSLLNSDRKRKQAQQVLMAPAHIIAGPQPMFMAQPHIPGQVQLVPQAPTGPMGDYHRARIAHRPQPNGDSVLVVDSVL